MIRPDALFMTILIFMTGASVFSFLNVVAERSVKGESFVKGRSYCPACGKTLSAKDLVPVISYILLMGRCRYCKEKIPFMDTLFEIIGGVLLVLTTYKSLSDALVTGEIVLWRVALKTVFVFVFFSVLAVVTRIDLLTMEIPNAYVIILSVIAIISIFIMEDPNITERLIGAAAVSVPMLVIALIVPGGFGGGDIKLMIPVGFLLGWKAAVFAFFVAILTGGIYGIYLLKTKKADKKDHFAFGPFLCLGATVGLLYGNSIIGAYLSLFHIG
ncbi:MAG: prepilin peptidase [Lachnospiraceae bacterium]|nr:prepilin peptidase [Lachnospiraceae bacterium]